MPDETFQDDLLDKFLGDWNIVRKFKSRKAENRAKVSWILNHQFLLIDMRDVNDPPRYEASIHIGYNPKEERYVAHWIDVFGGEFSETLGFGKRDGDSIEFTFKYPDGLLTNIFAYDSTRDIWTSKIDQQDESGNFVPFCFDMYTRA